MIEPPGPTGFYTPYCGLPSRLWIGSLLEKGFFFCPSNPPLFFFMNTFLWIFFAFLPTPSPSDILPYPLRFFGETAQASLCLRQHHRNGTHFFFPATCFSFDPLAFPSLVLGFTVTSNFAVSPQLFFSCLFPVFSPSTSRSPPIPRLFWKPLLGDSPLPFLGSDFRFSFSSLVPAYDIPFFRLWTFAVVCFFFFFLSPHTSCWVSPLSIS